MEEEKETNIDIKIIETTMKRLKYQTRKQLSGEEKRKEKRQEERKEEERKEEEKREGLDEVLSRTEFITGMNYETKHFTETEFNHIMNLLIIMRRYLSFFYFYFLFSSSFFFETVPF